MPSFAQVPAQNPSPGAYVETTRSGSGAIAPRTILVVAFTHGASPGPLLDPQIILGEAHPWPRGTQIDRMIAAVRRTAPRAPITAIAIDDGAGTGAAGEIAITGTATANGLLAVRINGRLVQVPVVSGDTATEVGDALEAAIAADPYIPVTPVNTTGTVALTSLLLAAESNAFTVAVASKQGEEVPAGLAVAVTDFAAGAGVADVTTAFVKVSDSRFFAIAQGMTDATAVAALAAEVERRWGATVEHHGQGFVGVSGTVAEQITAGAFNARDLTVMGAGKSLSPVWEWAAEAAGADASKTDPVSGYLGISMPGLDVPGEADRYDKGDRDALLLGGVSTFRVGGTGIILDRLVTNRSEDDDGNPDDSELALTARRTTEDLAFDWRSRMFNKYVAKGYKLADAADVVPAPGSKILTPNTLRAEAVAWFEEKREAGLVQGIDEFKASLTAAINGSDDNRIDAFLRPRLVKELVTIATLMETV